MVSLSEAMLLEEVSCGGSSRGSDEDDNDPSVIEQPQSATATSAIGAQAQRPRREAPEKSLGTGMAILQNTRAANPVLVTRWRAFRKICDWIRREICDQNTQVTKV